MSIYLLLMIVAAVTLLTAGTLYLVERTKSPTTSGAADLQSPLAHKIAVSAVQESIPRTSVPDPAPATLRPGVNFVYNGTEFFVLKHKFPKDQAERMLTALAELQDFFGKRIGPLHKEIDAFTRGWPINIAGADKNILEKQLLEIRFHAIAAMQEYQALIASRPSLRSDLGEIVQDNGSIWNFNGALSGYAEGVKLLPESPGRAVVERMLSSDNSKLAQINKALADWAFNFTSARGVLAKQELETFL